MTHDQDMAGRHHIDRVPIQPDDPRFIPRHRTSDVPARVTFAHGHGNHVGVGAIVTFNLSLGDPQSTAPRHQTRIDQVDPFLGDRRQQTLDEPRGHRPGIVIGKLAVIGHLNAIKPRTRQLGQRPPKMLRQTKVRLEVRDLLRDAQWCVDCACNVLAPEASENQLGNIRGDLKLRLARTCPEVRRDQHAVVRPEGAIGRERLRGEDIERRAAD